jgi:RNA polymerase sigma-70 factor (ECF subfamily)
VARPALVDGSVGVLIAPRGHLSRALRFTFVDGKIREIEVIGEAARLRQLELAVIDL